MQKIDRAPGYDALLIDTRGKYIYPCVIQKFHFGFSFFIMPYPVLTCTPSFKGIYPESRPNTNLLCFHASCSLCIAKKICFVRKVLFVMQNFN